MPHVADLEHIDAIVRSRVAVCSRCMSGVIHEFDRKSTPHYSSILEFFVHFPDQSIRLANRQRAVQHDICVRRVMAMICVRVPAIDTTPTMDHDRQCEYSPRRVRRELDIEHSILSTSFVDDALIWKMHKEL